MIDLDIDLPKYQKILQASHAVFMGGACTEVLDRFEVDEVVKLCGDLLYEHVTPSDPTDI